MVLVFSPPECVRYVAQTVDMKPSSEEGDNGHAEDGQHKGLFEPDGLGTMMQKEDDQSKQSTHEREETQGL
jgi:hypothetical protein